MDNNQYQPQSAPIGYDPNTGAPIYANSQPQLAPYKRKFNVFTVIATIIFIAAAFLPAFKFNSQFMALFDLTEVNNVTMGKLDYSYFDLVNMYEHGSIIMGDYDYEEIQTLKAFCYTLAGLGIFWGALGFLFGLLKKKVPVIVFGVFAVIHTVIYCGFTQYMVTSVNDGEYMTALSLDYGLAVMIVGAILYLISGCVYKTHA